MGKKRIWDVLRPTVLLLLAVGIGASFLFALGRLESGSDSRSKEQLERSLRRAIAAEYASSGAYPGSLDDIVDKYGVRIDWDRYQVFYMPVAENLAPELDVIDKADGREGGAGK